MFKEEIKAAAEAAYGKLKFLRRNPLGYFLMSVLAGMFIGFGVLLAFTAGGLTTETPFGKILMGLTFGVALSLVITAGAELFTGNNFVMTVGMLRKRVSVPGTLLLWLVCWIGNAVGGVFLAFLYQLTGLGNGVVGEFMRKSALAKMSATPVELITRGILCNVLVCLAVWCGFRLKSEAGKLIMVFWCLLAFITTGFEHSVANMTLLTYGLMSQTAEGLSIGGWFYNLGLVTAGNMIGGICLVALPYLAAAGREDNTK